MLSREQPDRIRVAFEDHRLVDKCQADPSGHFGPSSVRQVPLVKPRTSTP